MNIEHQADLKPFNSFGVAVTAAHLAEVSNEGELQQALGFAREQRLPVQILGAGSNVLFVNDFPGLVIRIAFKGIDWLPEQQVYAGAGENWHDLVEQCMRKGLHGLENLALIPGTVGAAPIQNIGAYGVELEQFLVRVKALDLENNQLVEMDRDECEFAYRDSLFKSGEPGRYVVLGVTLQLAEEYKPQLEYPALQQALMAAGIEQPSPSQLFDTVCEVRLSKLPDPRVLGNAGSFFKNPLVSVDKLKQLQQRFPGLPHYPSAEEELVKVPAAWLLDHLGWKGRKRGAAAVHSEHALVLVNPGEARGEDIYLLAQEMSSSVLGEFGIALQPEVRII